MYRYCKIAALNFFIYFLPSINNIIAKTNNSNWSRNKPKLLAYYVVIYANTTCCTHTATMAFICYVHVPVVVASCWLLYIFSRFGRFGSLNVVGWHVKSSLNCIASTASGPATKRRVDISKQSALIWNEIVVIAPRTLQSFWSFAAMQY